MHAGHGTVQVQLAQGSLQCTLHIVLTVVSACMPALFSLLQPSRSPRCRPATVDLSQCHNESLDLGQWREAASDEIRGV